MSDRKFDRLRRELERSSLGVDEAVPCCDYRDHRSFCSCDEHVASALHPFGRLGVPLADIVIDDETCEQCGAGPTELHAEACPVVEGQVYIDGGPVPPYLT